VDYIVGEKREGEEDEGERERQKKRKSRDRVIERKSFLREKL
jgi:hypothetical protein